MSKNREFEVRKGENGRLELWDSHEGKIWVRGKEKGKEEIGNERDTAPAKKEEAPPSEGMLSRLGTWGKKSKDKQ
jgi:hypothetical protein